MNTEQIINHSLMARIALWNNNFGQSESLSKELFCKHFGNRMGEHYFNKWFYTCEQSFMKMIGYYGANSSYGQIFCNMVAEQMLKYKNREKDFEQWQK